MCKMSQFSHCPHKTMNYKKNYEKNCLPRLLSTSWSFLKWSTPTFLHNFSKFTFVGNHENNFHSDTIFEIKTQGSQSKSLNYVKQFSKNVVSEIQTLKFQMTRLTILGQNVWWRRFSVNLMFASEFTNKFHN